MKKLTHVELIKPREKLSGYEGPTHPATTLELAEAASKGQTVWKVLRSSVGWHRRRADTRRIQMPDCQIVCRIIGGTGPWYFVHAID